MHNNVAHLHFNVQAAAQLHEETQSYLHPEENRVL